MGKGKDIGNRSESKEKSGLLERLRALRLPDGNEAMLAELARRSIETAFRELDIEGIRKLGVLEGITRDSEPDRPVTVDEQERNLDQLITYMLDFDEEKALAAVQVLLEQVDRQKDGISKAALMEYSMRMYKERAENMRRDDSFLKFGELWAATRFFYREVRAALGQKREKGPSQKGSFEIYNDRYYVERNKAALEYLSPANSLMDFANRYTTLTFSSCTQALNGLLSRSLKLLFIEDGILGKIPHMNRMRNLVFDWPEKDIHALIRFIAQDHYGEIEEVHKSQILDILKQELDTIRLTSLGSVAETVEMVQQILRSRTHS